MTAQAHTVNGLFESWKCHRLDSAQHDQNWGNCVDQRQNRVYFRWILIECIQSPPLHWASALWQMATVHPTINDQITRVQLRLLKQVLQCKCFLSFTLDWIDVLVLQRHMAATTVSGGSRICQKGGGDHGERVEREPNLGSGGGAPSGVQGQSPWWGSGGRSHPEAESFFLHFYAKSGQKLRIFSENLPPCLSRAAMTSPNFWSMGEGGGRPDRP